MTYTTSQAAAIFNVKPQTLQARWTKRYPKSFIVAKRGGGYGKQTQYKAAPIDKLKYYLDHMRALRKQIGE